MYNNELYKPHICSDVILANIVFYFNIYLRCFIINYTFLSEEFPYMHINLFAKHIIMDTTMMIEYCTYT